MQLLLAAVVAGLLFVASHAISLYSWGPLYFVLPSEGKRVYTDGITVFVRDLIWVSAFWAYFNLLPVYPLDGGRIARGIALWADPRSGVRQSLILSVVVGLALVIVGFVTQDRLLSYFFLFLTYAKAEALRWHEN